jgi:hypothetical protein
LISVWCRFAANEPHFRIGEIHIHSIDDCEIPVFIVEVSNSNAVTVRYLSGCRSPRAFNNGIDLPVILTGNVDNP